LRARILRHEGDPHGASRASDANVPSPPSAQALGPGGSIPLWCAGVCALLASAGASTRSGSACSLTPAAVRSASHRRPADGPPRRPPMPPAPSPLPRGRARRKALGPGVQSAMSSRVPQREHTEPRAPPRPVLGPWVPRALGPPVSGAPPSRRARPMVRDPLSLCPAPRAAVAGPPQDAHPPGLVSHLLQDPGPHLLLIRLFRSRPLSRGASSP
jgi:hypothetical protein